MSTSRFAPTDGLTALGDLVRLTFPPAGRREIAEQGLALAARTLGADAGLLLVREGPGAPPHVEAVWGEADLEALGRFAERALETGDPVQEASTEEGRRAVALLLPGDVAALGVVALSRPASWGEEAKAFARSATRILSGAIRSHRTIVESREQRELLYQRNLELEILGELAARLQETEADDPGLLQAALELILDRLGLQAGWIFWGEAESARLDLAASRGVSDRFVDDAHEKGIGPCLCAQVFETGRLRFARNTTDCPRMPHLVGGTSGTAHACIPMKFERGVLGVLNIATRPGALFTAQELQFLETAAKQVSMAVDRARNSRAERRRNAEARAFTDLARRVGGSVDRERVLAAIGDYARELLGAERAAIFLGDGAGSLRLAHGSGAPFPRLEVGQTVDFAETGAKGSFEGLVERRVVALRDVRRDPRIDAEIASGWGVGSGIVVPLVARDELRGILVVTRPGPTDWTREQIEIAEGLGQQASLSIENAQLFADIRDTLKRLGDAQEATVRAERLAAVGVLAASLAHEVRNPLNSINLQLVLLSRRLGRLEAEARGELEKLVETARKEIARLDTLVQESLSLAKIDRLTVVPADPCEAVREVLSLMKPLAAERGVVVEAEIGRRLPKVPHDREKIKQVLINLMRNSIEAMPGGGTLRVSCGRHEGGVLIRVEDTGPGIETSADVFDLFVTTKPDGTGLGLPIARRIVEAHGGALAYESDPGRGTKFTITLKGTG